MAVFPLKFSHILSVGVTGLLLAGCASGASKDSDGITHQLGCVEVATQQLTLVNTSEQCSAGMVPVVWNTSDTGAERGADGVDGTDGANGVDGVNGLDGQRGPQGEPARQEKMENQAKLREMVQTVYPANRGRMVRPDLRHGLL